MKPCQVPLTLNRYDEPDTDGPLCTYLRRPGQQKCQWHWLMRQPKHVQVASAKERRKRWDMPVRMRVPQEEWPAGERWCSGCQSFVPLFYVQGSRCMACNSAAAHAQHVERTYGITGEDYERLLDWQGGRCYICRQVPRGRRLAVDHDHRTGQVRGLLCSNDEHGCNMQLRRLLNDVDMARRALEYVELGSLDRMRQGYPAMAAETPRQRAFPPQDAAPTRSAEEWDPWND